MMYENQSCILLQLRGVSFEQQDIKEVEPDRGLVNYFTFDTLLQD